TNAGEGAAIGAAAGAIGGAAIGAGIMAGIIPVVGPVLALGTLGTILVNAAGGAVIVGVAGALIGWGIPEEDAAYYENEVKAGRYLVTVECGYSDDVLNIIKRHGGSSRSAVCAMTDTSRATGTASGGAGRTVQVREEQLRADKQQVNAGEVKVRKEVHTEHKQVNVPVEREEVVIERRPASGRAPTGELKSEEIRIPVKEEQVRVTKEPVVKEEVVVSKRQVHDTKTVSGDVKKEDVVVETEGQAKVRQTGRTDKR
ncbi:MAG TPA: YsnF/AvaK domain-containing protein, partial [Candidatus Limnocylindria bacterium]|nr:YsnF/AvaK domain-containing protein [Candidatus Limnocylindria bacterium]